MTTTISAVIDRDGASDPFGVRKDGGLGFRERNPRDTPFRTRGCLTTDCLECLFFIGINFFSQTRRLILINEIASGDSGLL